MFRDRNPDHWKLLVFYYNPETPRLWVAKRSGAPITLNFARPMAWLIAAIPFAIVFISAGLQHLHFVR